MTQLQGEFPTMSPSALVQAILYVERDVVPNETLEAYTSRVRETVRRAESHAVRMQA
ncbi:MAG TPA: hypothetical protein VGE29_17010 [Prosthecobacter sp.]